jgi:citrate lyase beta subunit
VIPKVHSPADIHAVCEAIEEYAHADTKESLKIIASIESARGLMNLKEVEAVCVQSRNSSSAKTQMTDCHCIPQTRLLTGELMIVYATIRKFTGTRLPISLQPKT